MTALLDQHRPRVWMVMRCLSGMGPRSGQRADRLVGEFGNAWVLVACKAPALQPLLDGLRLLLGAYGGLCLVSDVMSPAH